MSCSPFDLKEYFLRELPDPQQRLMEAHVKACENCRTEIERLRLTEAALLTLREEEIPQRIAFVSDKIFEPSAVARWWASFWGSAARLGFASAAMLSVALVVFALKGTVPTTISAVSSSAEFERRVQAIVAESEARQEKKMAQLAMEIESRSVALDVAQKRESVMRRASYLRAQNGVNQ